MTKFLLCFVATLAFIQAGLALKCHRCSNECESEATTEENCPMPTQNQEVACLKEVYKDSRKNIMTDKKCVLIPKGNKYDCIAIQNTEKVACEVCSDKDLCNGALSSIDKNSVVAIFGVLSVVLVPYFY